VNKKLYLSSSPLNGKGFTMKVRQAFRARSRMSLAAWRRPRLLGSYAGGPVSMPGPPAAAGLAASEPSSRPNGLPPSRSLVHGICSSSRGRRSAKDPWLKAKTGPQLRIDTALPFVTARFWCSDRREGLTVLPCAGG